MTTRSSLVSFTVACEWGSPTSRLWATLEAAPPTIRTQIESGTSHGGARSPPRSVQHGSDQQSGRIRPVAPRMIRAADHHRVAGLHEHLVDVGDQVDLTDDARDAVERVGAVHARVAGEILRA